MGEYTGWQRQRQQEERNKIWESEWLGGGDRKEKDKIENQLWWGVCRYGIDKISMISLIIKNMGMWHIPHDIVNERQKQWAKSIFILQWILQLNDNEIQSALWHQSCDKAYNCNLLQGI